MKHRFCKHLAVSTVVFLSWFGPGNALAQVAVDPVNQAAGYPPIDESDPSQVLTAYLRALYSRDANTAYNLLSVEDKNTKSLEQYSEESAAFNGNALVLSRALSAGIHIENMRSNVKTGQAEIIFDATLPNASDPLVTGLVHGFNNQKLSDLDQSELQSLIDDIKTRVIAGTLPVLRSVGENWNLLLESGKWRVFENWAGAVQVNFSSYTFEDLDWAFIPMQEQIMAKHGETVHMKYLATNTGAMETTGKARHIIGPERGVEHLEIISCFCFLEQTLAPGESVEMPVIFRVGYEAPEDLNALSVEYEFYPIDRFPDSQKPESNNS